MQNKKRRNPEAVKADILKVATEEFAQSGFAGARVNLIAEKTQTSKRMLYYYFGGKEQLYARVVQDAYSDIRAGEQAIDIESLTPTEAVRALVKFTFEHQRANPNFIRLVMIENIHDAKHLAADGVFERVNEPAITKLRQLYERGVESGEFRVGLEVLELHWMISSMCFFNNSNRATFGAAFGTGIFTPCGQAHLIEQVQELIIRYMRP